MIWHLRIYGDPAPKGSMKPVPCGKPVIVGGERHYRIRDVRLRADEPERLERWKHAVEIAILEGGRPREPVTGPVRVGATFIFARPKKPAHSYPPPDLDKLLRAIGDCFTGKYYQDDSQIEAWDPAPRKRYAEPGEAPGAFVIIETEKQTKQLHIDEARGDGA